MPLIERNREKGLPNPLTSEALQRLGVSDSLVPRTLQAFKVLDLIGDDGRHMETLESFRRAPEADYRPMLAAWLNAAYAHALDVIDPATADEISIRDAFRHYNPISMQPRMITLFISLYEMAGVRASGEAKPSPKKPVTPASRQTTAPRLAVQSPKLRSAVHPPLPPLPPSGMHPALAGLLASLPSADQGWSKADRDRWYEAFGVILDLALPPGKVAKLAIAEADNAEG